MKKLLKRIALISVILAIINILINVPTLKKLCSGQMCKKKAAKPKKKPEAVAEQKEKCTALATIKQSINDKKAEAAQKNAQNKAEAAEKHAKKPLRVEEGVYVSLEAPLIVNVLFIPSVLNGVQWQKRTDAAREAVAASSVSSDFASKLIDVCTKAITNAVKAKLSK